MGLHREECDLLLGCCDGGSEFSYARECRLMVGIICHLQVGQLMIECRLDVVECVISGSDICGGVVSIAACGAST